MTGPDGLYCAPMLESYLKDGVLLCSTPKLIELVNSLGVGADTDYPEPQGSAGMAVYRAFGDWKYLDALKPYADYRLLEGEIVESAERLLELLKQGKPAFVCSMIAIKKIADHKDGFAIHGQDPGNQWAHNMAFHGMFTASDGAVFIRQSNESWGPQHVYNLPIAEVKRWFDRDLVQCASIGNIAGPRSSPPIIA